MNSNYKTISEVKEGIYKEKGSKFLAYISPVTSVKEALDKSGIEIPYPHQVEIRKQG